MAAVNFLGGTQSGTSGTSYGSSSFTPTAGSLLVVFVRGTSTRAVGATLASSVGGLNFDPITAGDWGSTSRNYAYVADAVSTAVSQTVTFDCTGDTASGLAILVLEITGLTRVGTDAIKQFADEPGLDAEIPAATFPSSVLTGNPTITFFAQNINANITVPTGWTEDFDTGGASARAEVAHRDSGFTGTTITYGNAASSSWGQIIVEMDASDPGGGGESTAVNTAEATYTALSIGKSKSKAIATATVSYTALSIGTGSALGINTASATYTALPIGHSKSKAIATASATYTALAVGFGNNTAVNTALATYTALSIGHKKSKAIGTAISAHFAMSIVLPAAPVLNVRTDQVIASYTPKPLPQINKQFDPVTKYLLDELKRMQATINQLTQAAPVVADREPSKPRRGMIRYATAPWDPLGTGFEGYVQWNGSAWAAL
jgi:hypothetical protein